MHMLTSFDATVIAAFLALMMPLTCFVLAKGAYAWSQAISAAHQARAHAIQAQVEQETIHDAKAAIDDIEGRTRARAVYEPPSEDELREAILAARAAKTDEREYTTTTNEGIEIESPIPPGGLYHTEGMR
jgi:hypothetical protein